MIEITDGVYWVGAVDWNIRNFHGYITHRGTSYNAYLLVGEKVAVVDTVKAPFFDEMVHNIRQFVDLEDIDYIISNHAEPDHSGNVTRLAELIPDVEVIASERGKAALMRYYGEETQVTSIKEKPDLDLGGMTMKFIPVPMAHWPDSMVTYITGMKLLLSNDAFGQHLASSGRFDDTVDRGELVQETRAYYANILMPLHGPVGRAMKALEGVELDIIAPSHGIVWRDNLELVLGAYRRWVAGETDRKAVIVYDTMWGSTEKIAKALAEGLISEGVQVKIHSLSVSHKSDVITELLDASGVLIGSPTINNTVFPSVAGFLAYMRGLRPRNKVGAAFGSYGWSGGAKRYVEDEMREAGIELLDSDLEFVFRPDDEELVKAKEYGKELASRL